MSFLGQGGAGNNFARGVMQGYSGMPLGTQPFGMNATTFGSQFGQLLNQPSSPMPAPPQQPPRSQMFQQLLQALAQQRAKMTPYSSGGGGLF
jgi:hypothetical protein